MPTFKCPVCGFDGLIKLRRGVSQFGPEEDEKKILNYLKRFGPCFMTQITRAIRRTSAGKTSDIVERLRMNGQVSIRIDSTAGRPRSFVDLIPIEIPK